MPLFNKLICKLRGHCGEWRQHLKPYRIYRECERCGHIDYSIKRAYAADNAAFATIQGAPELSKLMRNSVHPEAPE